MLSGLETAGRKTLYNNGFSRGLEQNYHFFKYQEDTYDIHYSFFIPANICFAAHPLPASMEFTPDPVKSPVSQQMDLLAVFRPSRDRQALLSKVKFWSWTTLVSSGLNLLVPLLIVATDDPEIGVFSIATHAWFGVSNIFLGNAYYKLNESLNTYGPKGRNPYIGIGAAYGAFIFAGIGVAMGATMFDGSPTMPVIIATATSAGLSNILGISAFVYYLFYDKSKVIL
jgi:hypothetical protein